MASQYDYWTKKKNEITRACDALPYEDYTQELITTYRRHIEIIEEILEELVIEFDDDQYTETTSWSYEEELTALNAKESELEPIVQQLVEAGEERAQQEEHQKLVSELGMTQEEYEANQKELAESARRRRLRIAKAKNKKKP